MRTHVGHVYTNVCVHMRTLDLWSLPSKLTFFGAFWPRGSAPSRVPSSCPAGPTQQELCRQLRGREEVRARLPVLWGPPSGMGEAERRGYPERGVCVGSLRVPAGKGRPREPWQVRWLWAAVTSANTGADTREGPPAPRFLSAPQVWGCLPAGGCLLSLTPQNAMLTLGSQPPVVRRLPTPEASAGRGKVKRFVKAIFWNDSIMLVFVDFRITWKKVFI